MPVGGEASRMASMAHVFNQAARKSFPNDLERFYGGQPHAVESGSFASWKTSSAAQRAFAEVEKPMMDMLGMTSVLRECRPRWPRIVSTDSIYQLRIEGSNMAIPDLLPVVDPRAV